MTLAFLWLLPWLALLPVGATLALVCWLARRWQQRRLRRELRKIAGIPLSPRCDSFTPPPPRVKTRRSGRLPK